MTRFLIIAALFCFAVPAALAVPPAGKGKPESSEASSQTVETNAAKACKAERGATAQSIAAFNDKYGTNANKANAFGKCVSMKVKKNSEDEAETNAAKACKAERGATAQSIAAFNDKYGTNANKKNAFGKCVSMTVKEQKAEDQEEAEANAAKKCKAERGTTAQSMAAFKTKYGTNANKANAFGKCVSKLAKAQSSSS